MLNLGTAFDSISRVLCVGAHSDDIEIGAGGAILTLLDRNPDVHLDWVVLSAGEERVEEARASAKRFTERAASADVRIEGFRERFFPYLPEVKEYFDHLGRDIDPPDLILCPRTEDLHQDHRVVAELTTNTFRDHLILQYEIVKYDADLGNPNVFVPLSAARADEKIEWLFELFPSQIPRYWFTDETFRGILRLRGVESRAPEGYAEGFHCRKLVVF
jgi:LmbE family N-acetylglucosaminyl deacetylase